MFYEGVCESGIAAILGEPWQPPCSNLPADITADTPLRLCARSCRARRLSLPPPTCLRRRWNSLRDFAAAWFALGEAHEALGQACRRHCAHFSRFSRGAPATLMARRSSSCALVRSTSGEHAGKLRARGIRPVCQPVRGRPDAWTLLQGTGTSVQRCMRDLQASGQIFISGP